MLLTYYIALWQWLVVKHKKETLFSMQFFLLLRNSKNLHALHDEMQRKDEEKRSLEKQEKKGYLG